MSKARSEGGAVGQLRELLLKVGIEFPEVRLLGLMLDDGEDVGAANEVAGHVGERRPFRAEMIKKLRANDLGIVCMGVPDHHPPYVGPVCQNRQLWSVLENPFLVSSSPRPS